MLHARQPISRLLGSTSLFWAGAIAVPVVVTPLPVCAQATTEKAATDKDGAGNRKALDSKKDALKENTKRQQEIQQDLAKIASERARIDGELRGMAATVQSAETRLTSTEERLQELDLQEKAVRASLTERYGKISKLLSVLQRMGRNPPPVMITKREDALKMVRSAMLISAAFPEMRSQAVALSTKLSELVKVMDNVRQERASAEAASKELTEKRTELTGLMDTKKKLYSDRQNELQSVRTAAADIAKSVEKLGDLIAKVDQTVSKSTGLGAYEDGKTPVAPGQDVALLTPQVGPASPNAPELAPSATSGKSEPLAPKVAFSQTKASLPMPAAGRRVLSFGEKTQYGAQSKGIVLETRPYAQVTSPCDGWIVFAGEFRSYGRVLIINPGGGYHVLMAGLSQIDVSTGQFVVAGEPVATMSAGQTGQSSAPVLYIEFRKDGEPVDPDPWWVAGKQVESGKKVQG